MNDQAPRLTLEEWLRAAYADDESGCPPPESFLEAESGALSREARRRLDEHAVRCPACAAERDLARLFDSGPQAAGIRSADVGYIVSRLESGSPPRAAALERSSKLLRFPALRRPAARRNVWRLAAAATVVLAAGFVFQLTRPGAPPLPAPPRSESGVRGGEVEALQPAGEVAELPAELRWRPRSGAHAYRLRLSRVDDTVLWETTVESPPARLPGEVIRQLDRAVVYLWTVEALDASGATLARSEPVRFRARPAAEERSRP